MQINIKLRSKSHLFACAILNCAIQIARLMMLTQYYATDDQDQFASPEGWDFKIYCFNPKQFWYSKTTAPLFDGCEIGRYDFRGHIRYRAALKESKLQIGFIDSYSSLDLRLQGCGKIESIMMLSFAGDEWDGVTDVGALGIELSFDERTTQKILTPEIESLLTQKHEPGRSIIVPMGLSAHRLKAVAQRYLDLIDQEAGLNATSRFGHRDAVVHELGSKFQSHSSFAEYALTQMTKNVIDEAIAPSPFGCQLSSAKRRNIALTVEQMLWEPPSLKDEDFNGTLQEFSQLLDVSVRSIQIAIEEQFGIGFVALRRLVRYSQVRRAILASKGDISLTSIATEYGLHFGRLASEYQQLFGLRPSEEVARVRQRMQQLDERKRSRAVA